mgnify:CR=1 FL=1
MKISLDGYQLVEAAQAYIKKEYDIDLSTVECYETWMSINHKRVEYKRDKDHMPKRDSKGHLIVDKEKSERIEECFPTQESATLELYYERRPFHINTKEEKS